MIGQTIAHYRITAKLGEGGMGEVYRATDTKLDREVAIKILPEAFASDPARMARFEREAKVLASLNHPNIAAIYGVEERALVMELVEGEPPKGPMGFDDAWKIALQMADALEYAHDKGVIHRDLKPANVKVTPDGVVKLLDFGLAKAFAPEDAPSTNPDNSPTLTLGATNLGVILGTAGYMAPEQAKGKKVDKRADIWSWGVVLYEILTGERLFQGDDAVETLAAVIHKQPDLERVPAKVRVLLSECLQKDPKLRLRDVGDARRLLEERPAAEWRFGASARVTTGVLLIALGIISFIHFSETPPRKAVLRYAIAAPENTSLLHSFAISPDGRHVAISAVTNGKLQLWLEALDALQAQPLPGTDNAMFPFWSPDSRYIGFFVQSKLKKIAASGGPAQWVCDSGTLGAGATWNRDNVIVFSSSGGIQRVSAAGGNASYVTKTRGPAMFPVFLPDGRHLLYLLTGVSVEQDGVYLSSLDGKENRRVLADESSVVFAAGRLLFSRENTLMAQPFEAAGGQIVGEVFPVAEGVSLTANGSYVPVTVSDSGVLLYQSGGRVGGGNNQMGWYDRDGKLLEAIGAPGRVFEPAISPDQKSIVFRRIAGPSFTVQDLWLWDLTRGAEQRFTTDAYSKFAPFWSPKGDHIVFASGTAGRFNLHQRASSGTGQDELLLANGNDRRPTQWTRDGRFIVYSENDPKTKWDIWVLPMDGGAERKPVPFLHSEFNELLGQLSPDNQWMAYTSDKTGQREVYVAPFPTGDGETKVSIAGGAQPRWRGDAKELFFVGRDGNMMVVAVKAAAPSKPGGKPSFEPGVPQPLFEVRLPVQDRTIAFEYDVAADGRHFLLDTERGSLGSTPSLTAVVNWDAEVKK